MAVQDHVAIILSCSLDRAARNRKKPDQPPRYYIRAALPPDAAADLGTAMANVAPGGNWKATSHNIKQNQALQQPYAGVPADWLIVKFDTQYPVPVYSANGGVEIPVNAENSARIRSEFFSGQRARIEASPYLWHFEGKVGISWNLWGVLAVGGGERLPGSGGGGFTDYRPAQQPGAAQSNGSGGFGNNTPQDAAATGYNTPAQPAAVAAQSNDNPFQQPGGGANGNPFA